MAYHDNFKDEPVQGQTETFEPKHHEVPTKPGFYWVKIPDNIRQTKDGKLPKPARSYWNGIAHVYGVAPFLKMKVWDFPNHSTSFGNAPHLLEYGPRFHAADAPLDAE